MPGWALDMIGVWLGLYWRPILYAASHFQAGSNAGQAQSSYPSSAQAIGR